MKSSFVAVFASLMICAAGSYASDTPVITVTVDATQIKQIPDKFLGTLVDSIREVAIMVPTKANNDAYLVIQREVLDRASEHASAQAPTK